MAQSGFTPIQLYRSATPGAVPLAANLAPGELALNTADEKIFFENASGSVVSIGSGGGTVTSVAASGGTTGLTFSGSPITSSGTLTLSGTLAVANGGTGATTLTANNVILGNGTSAVQFVAPGTAGNVLTSNGTTWTSAAAGASLTGITQSTTPFETALGFEAGLNTTGVNNTFVGYRAGKTNTTGTNNTAVGWGADVGSAGDSNSTFGRSAGATISTGSYNSAFGGNSGGSTTGVLNSAFGWLSLNQATTAYENAGIGARALQQITTGHSNTAMGYAATQLLNTANNNVAVGHSAGLSVSSGNQNTLIGAKAGYSGTNDLTTGSNNIIIGYNAAATALNVNNEATIGNSSIATLRCQVTTITSLSDMRDKDNIRELDAGLAFINAITPARFTWNMRDGGKAGEVDTGFIAQDLQAAMAETGVDLPGLVYDANPDKLEAGYGKLLPVLVKAVQELSAKVDALEAQLKGA
jgi:hypothetical protein